MVVVLYCNLCQLFTGKAVLVHVVTGDHCIKTRECCSCKTLPLTIGCSGEDIGCIRNIRHLLNTCGDNHIGHAGRYCCNCLAECKTSGSTCCFHTGCRYMEFSTETYVIGNKSTYMFLANKSASRHRSDKHRIDLFACNICILEGCNTCFRTQISERGIPALSKCRNSGTNNCYFSHFCTSHLDLSFVACVHRII